MYDFHVHSEYSMDCKTPIKDVIHSGIDKGIKELCFTDHTDFDFCGDEISFDTNKYINHIDSLAQQYSGQIKLLKGVELGLQSQIVDQCTDFVKKHPFDFVIMSMHTCDKQNIWYDNYYDDKNLSDIFTKYYEEFIYCAKHFDEYCVLGHIDLLRRYNKDIAKIDQMDYHDLLTDLLKTTIQKGKGIELNTGGLRYWLKDINPTYNIIKLYKDLGGEIITFGSDSHTAADLGSSYQYAVDVLKLAGFKYITTYEKMKPHFNRL